MNDKYFSSTETVPLAYPEKVELDIVINGEDETHKRGTVNGMPFIETKPSKDHWFTKEMLDV